MKRILTVLLCAVMLLGSVALATGMAPVCESHYFDVWYYRRDGMHKSVCLHDGCGFICYVPCDGMSATFEGKTLTVCPVCGHYGEKDGSFIPYIRADLYNYNASPLGEICVYRYDDPFEDGSVKAAISVIFEKAGVDEHYEGGFRLIIPTALESGFTLYGEDGGEIEYTYENGLLTFTCDAGCGIYFVK